LVAEGRWHGRIVATPQGENGFGYDPHFWLPEYGCTVAELDPAEKNRVSHRGRALAQLLDQLRGIGTPSCTPRKKFPALAGALRLRVIQGQPQSRPWCV